MKKAIASLALVGALGVGGILTYSMTGSQGETKQEVPSENVQATSSEVKEVVDVPNSPTERTVNTNGDVPWNYMSAEQIETSQSSGEIVYLWSDAEAIEEYTIQLANNPDTTPYDKDTLATSWSNHMVAFLNGVKDYHPDQLDYFMKIEEAKSAMASFDYNKVPGLIEEAKSLR
jgi:hypothetical protein